ncbi:MAG: hypothetical protein N4A33_03795 [Bacteriovoracaceae bacterium]|jgi:hypothetical protein|nr:hypothetical protein [Bacteriovoracaceae bacterium]
MRKKINLLLIIISIIITSCGDLFTKKNANERINQYADAGCEIDTQALGRILEVKIEREIDCLGENMDMFLDIVKTSRPGYLSQVTLKDFILNGPMNIDPEILPIVDSVFDLSFLIFGGDRGFISRRDVSKLVTFFKIFNSNMVTATGYFKNEDKVDFYRHDRESKIVLRSFANIASSLRDITRSDRAGRVDEIKTDVFLNNFFDDAPETLSKINSLMFLKEIFLGGEDYRLTHIEFLRALNLLPELSSMAFDFVKIDRFNFIGVEGQQTNVLSIYEKSLDFLSENMFFAVNSDHVLFNLNNLLEAVEQLLPDVFTFEASNGTQTNFYNYRQEILAVKPVLVGKEAGGPREDFTAAQVHTLIYHLRTILDKGKTIYRVYERNKDLLASTDRLSVDFDDLVGSPEQVKDFSRMVNNYKFIKGNRKAPVYDYKYSRNADAFFEVSVIEYVVTNLMMIYGKADSRARGGYHMTYDHTYAFLMKIRRLLRDLGIISIGRKGGNEVAGTTDNLVLMSTLFQFQSDGCSKGAICMEVPEISEFLIGLLTALQVKDFFIDEMKKVCQIPGQEVDEHGRIMVDCFRRNFLNVITSSKLDDGTTLSSYLPKLVNYIKSLTKDATDPNDLITSAKYVDFVAETESFTRTCTQLDGQSLPMKPTDAFAVFAGLLNLESTFLRLDKNENGIMDGTSRKYSEVMDAYYEVYEGAIKALVAPDGGFMEKLAKPIFKYLIKYGKVPETDNCKISNLKQCGSILKFVKFLFKFNKRADASRLTVATILKTIGEQSETAKKFPFKCECLVPGNECQPEDGSWE